MTTAPTPETITVRDAIVEAIASTDRLNSEHGQLCPVVRHLQPIWHCDCWRLTRLKQIADVICARLDSDT